MLEAALEAGADVHWFDTKDEVSTTSANMEHYYLSLCIKYPNTHQHEP